MMIPIPGEKQLYDWDCGVACLYAIMKYYKQDPAYKDLIALSKQDKEWGIEPTTIKRIAETYNFKANIIEDEPSILEVAIRQQKPLIVLYQTNLTKDSGHYAIVCGIENRHIILSNPNKKELTQYPAQNFLKRWRGAGTKNLAIFIYPLK